MIGVLTGSANHDPDQYLIRNDTVLCIYIAFEMMKKCLPTLFSQFKCVFVMK